MTDDPRSLVSLVDSELALVTDPAQRAALRVLLVEPARLSLAWEYGEADQRFDCWLVGRSSDEAILLVYCERGFGPSDPWGFVFAHTGSMGMDSQWHSGLVHAAIGAGLVAAPAGYEVPGPRPSGPAD
jgi:hypothetical protein